MHHHFVASLAAATLSLGLISAASAADLGAQAPIYTKAPPVAPVWNWTGFYLGGNAGWAREQGSGTSDFLDTVFAPGSPFASDPQSNSLSDSGFIGGVQLGYNWQFLPHFVLGAEGDWDWLHTKYSFCRQTDIDSTACLDAPPNIDGFESISSQANWLATARARAGVTWDRFMFYGTGGAAWGNIETTESLSCLTDGCGRSSTLKLAASSSETQTKAGWVAGLGAEAMLTPNWSVKAEWLHVDLGNLTDSFATAGATGTQTAVWSRDERFDIIRAGVNYRFGAYP